MKKTLFFTFKKISLLLIAFGFLFTSCSENQSIVNNVDEREANEILVFLASKGISATKIQIAAGETPDGRALFLWNISVPPEQSLNAMSILNHNGLPRKKGSTLLELFAKQGLMTSDKEENIRYQAGIEEELKNIIRKIDGVIDADVQISFPATENLLPGAEVPKIKASIYVKHQGVLDDPNNHLEIKIKRLISGSIDGLSFENVSVISDRSRFTDVQLQPEAEMISPKKQEKDYVSIWSVVMTKNSASKFRFIFLSLIGVVLVLGSILGWLIYKAYPYLKTKRNLEEKTSDEDTNKET